MEQAIKIKTAHKDKITNHRQEYNASLLETTDGIVTQRRMFFLSFFLLGGYKGN